MKVSARNRVFLAWVLWLWVGGLAAGADYIWPLPASSELSSGFADYRSTHYHAGLDIRTLGRVGLQAVAVQEGYVWRIQANWWGYGKVLYLKLADGNIAVYAHLSEFAPPVEEYLRASQLAAGRYYVNLFPEAGRFKFKRGELVAKTGATGVGAPHLHFEIRSADNEPLNPLLFFPQIKDTQPPRIEEVTIRPLDGLGEVDGLFQPRSYPVRYEKAGKAYRLTSEPAVRGRVGIEVKAADLRNDSQRKLSVDRLRLWLDERLVFETGCRRLSFDSWDLNTLDYSHFQAGEGESNYRNLYYDYDLRSACQNYDSGCASCLAMPLDSTLAAGKHAVRIEALDQAGNSAVCSFTLQRASDFRLNVQPTVGPSQSSLREILEALSLDADTHDSFVVGVGRFRPDSSKFKPAGSLKLAPGPELQDQLRKSLDSLSNVLGRFAIVRLDFRQGQQTLKSYLVGLSRMPAAEPLTAEMIAEVDFVHKVEFVSSYPVVEISPSKLYAFFQRQGFEPCFVQPIAVSADLRFPLRMVRPLREQPYGQGFEPLLNHLVIEKLLSEDYRLYRVGHESVCPFPGGRLTLPPNLAHDQFFQVVALPKGQGQHQTGVRIVPADLLFYQDYLLTLEPDSGKPLQRQAIYRLDQGPSFSGGRSDSTGLTAGERRFGSFGVMVDTVPPMISGLRPAHLGRTTQPRPEIRFRLSDNLSGFDSDTLVKVLLDGEFLICEYDVDNRIATARPNFSLTAGAHKLEITARDRMGNVAEVKSKFTFVTAGKK